jgi:outer membrane protein TolC
MKLRCRLCLSGSALVFLSALSTGANAADLMGAYREAYRWDVQWLGALSKYEQSPEFRVQALSQLLPNFSYTQTKNTVTQEINTAGVFTPQRSYPSDTRALTLRQPVLRPQEVVGLVAANAQVARAAHAFRDEQQLLAVRLVSNYLDVVQAAISLRAIRASQSLAKANLARAQVRLRIGYASELEGASALAELEKANAQEIQVAETLELTTNQLSLQTGGIQVSGVNKLEAFDPKMFELPNYRAIVSRFIEQSPRVLVAGAEVDIARAALRRAQAAHLPTVDLVAQSLRSSSDNVYFTNTQVNSRSVGVQLTVPLYAGGATSSLVRSALKELEQAEFKLIDITNRTRLQLQADFNSIKSHLSAVVAYQAAHDAAKMSLESNMLGSRVGSRSELDVQRSVSELEQTFSALHQSKVEAIKAWFRLHAITGQVDEAMIASFNMLLK